MKKKLRLIATATLMIFFMNTLLPFFAVYPLKVQESTGGFTSAKAPAPGGKILICTSQGYKWITLKELEDEENKPGREKHYECALCFISAHGLNNVLIGSFTPFAPPVYVNKATYRENRSDNVIRKLAALGHFTRAPPLLV